MADMHHLWANPALSDIANDLMAVSVLLHNPMIRARTFARPAEMRILVLELAKKNPGAAHFEGALDARYPTLHLKGIEVRAISQAETPEATMVREHHNMTLDSLSGGYGAYTKDSAALPPRQLTHTPPEDQYALTQVPAHSRADAQRPAADAQRPAIGYAHEAQRPSQRPATELVDARAMTAGMKIREVFGEMLLDRSPTNRPRWGGRLVGVLENARGPFGISSISDALAPAVEEFKKDHPRLVAFLIRSGGAWPAPSDAESLELYHSAAKAWARRLIRPILLGIIDQLRKQVAELNGDAKPKWFSHEELDKELRAAKDVHGDYLINPVVAAKRQREPPA